MYEECKIWGPYLCSDKRLRVVVKCKGDKGHTISYPKFLMEKHLGRHLLPDETVDHLDGNPLNNDISNLRVVRNDIHAILDVYRRQDFEVTCSMCGKRFIVEGRRHNDRNRNGSGYFCSRSCRGRYGALVQHGKIQHFKEDKIIPPFYRLKDGMI